MRYSGNQKNEAENTTAADLLQTLSYDELRKIFKQYGEEKFSEAIAEAIVQQRRFEPISMTKQLSDIVLAVYREKLKSDKEIPWIGGLHPATKVFQALRIAVNKELEVLESVLPQAIAALASGGRLAVITFHSLEDRIVKHYFQKIQSQIKIITKKPVIASESELASNPRSRSAKLRVVEKA
jgi:16S rRNA (cytosine1402-N4)-methyltransferase